MMKRKVLLSCFFCLFTISSGYLEDGDDIYSNHEIVHPRKLTRDDLPKIKKYDAAYDLETTFKRYRLLLKREEVHPLKVVLNDYHITREGQDCHYQGTLENGIGHAVISTCKGGLTGTIFDNEDGSYLIKFKPEEKHHILKKIDDDKLNTLINQSKDIVNRLQDTYKLRLRREIDAKVDLESEKERYRRENDDGDAIDNIPKFVSLGFVIDRAFFLRMKKNIQATIDYVYAIVNHMDFIFSDANVNIALTYLELWTEKDGINVTDNTNKNLDLFEGYNQKVLMKKYKWDHDNAHLLTGVKQYSGLTGLGAVGSLCYGSSNAISYAWHSDPVLVAGTSAHEFGHNFGLYHFKPPCECKKKPCLMTAYASWSYVNGLTNCSIEAINKRCRSGWCQCLVDKPTKVVGGPMCGNGFVERGEECDCGKPQYCKSPCCDPQTCKLQPGAKCAEGRCCKNCQIKQQGVICRKKLLECDIEERCDGVSSVCPKNIFREDYTSCSNNQGYCHGGVCSPTLNQQCKALWGPNAFHGGLVHGCRLIYGTYANMDGDQFGNCGKTDDGKFIKCSKRDVNCGKVQCYGDKLPIFMIVGHSRQTSYYRDFAGKRCITGTTNRGKDMGDVTLAKEGTKCGEGKVCRKQKCVDTWYLKESLKASGCSKHLCGKNGICTNTGGCYCLAGYKCPDCKSADIANKYGKLCLNNAFHNTRIASVKCKDQCFNKGICNEEYGGCYCPAGYECPDCQLKNDKLLHGRKCLPMLENLGKTKFPDYRINCSSSYVFPNHCVKQLSRKKGFRLIANYRQAIDWANYQVTIDRFICQCAKKAKMSGYHHFALQFYGECWATNLDEKEIAKLPLSGECIDGTYKKCKGFQCIGKNNAAYLYHAESLQF